MKKLLELANMIKNQSLREKTIKLLKEPSLSNTELLYPTADITKVPAWIGAHHNYEGGQLEHTASVVKLALAMADIFEATYKLKINRDHLIAGGLLHDIGKLFLLKKVGKNWTFTGCVLDHAHLSAAELYARGFPEEVVHIAAAHGGDMGAAGANPRTIEATLIYYADMIDSSIETAAHGTQQLPLQLLFMQPTEEKKES
ncbi:MAG: HDIG domain-containing protein [Candidatus Aenigmatarchaeota archaeon]|nr:HDIG domain-containing protein [Candidatus Aenigmarchaeota archaeon]